MVSPRPRWISQERSGLLAMNYLIPVQQVFIWRCENIFCCHYIVCEDAIPSKFLTKRSTDSSSVRNQLRLEVSRFLWLFELVKIVACYSVAPCLLVDRRWDYTLSCLVRGHSDTISDGFFTSSHHCSWEFSSWQLVWLSILPLFYNRTCIEALMCVPAVQRSFNLSRWLKD